MLNNPPSSVVPVQVCVGVLVVDGRVLIGQRPAGVRLAGCWEFPGGKLEPGEMPEACLQRELREELGIAITVDRPLTPIRHASPDLTVDLLPYLCSPASPELIETIQPHVNDELRWVTPGELGHYCFPPANNALIAEIQALRL